MQTLKIKYHTTNKNDLELIKSLQVQYGNLLRWMYNRICEGKKEKDREHLSKTLNNIYLDSWFIRSASKQSQWLYDANKANTNKLIFGGKKNFIRRCKGLITKEEYQAKKLSPIHSVGEANFKGNRKFRLTDTLDKIVFSPDRHTHIDIIFDGLSKNYKNILSKLYKLQETKAIPISYQLSQEYVYIMFDETTLKITSELKKVKNRVMAIDINPNYVGWSIVDWVSSSKYKVIKHGVYSIKLINDKDNNLISNHITSESPEKIYINNKRKYEIIEISKNLINKCIYYKCELFCVEDISIASTDKDKGKTFNRLVNNQWCRNKFINNIQKRCNLFNIKMLKVKPEYSSFVGNVVFRELGYADMELASIEIGRRGYEFKKQYIDKIENQRKNIVLPDILDFKGVITKSLEEFGIISECDNLVELYGIIKKSKIRYRLSLEDINPMFSRCFSKTSLILKYNN